MKLPLTVTTFKELKVLGLATIEIKHIDIVISTNSLGDFNTEEENKRYIEAVADAIANEYPNAFITVRLTCDESASAFLVNDDLDEKVSYHVKEIANQVWNAANY